MTRPGSAVGRRLPALLALAVAGMACFEPPVHGSRWLRPEPLLALAAARAGDGHEVDLRAIAGRPRWSAAPSAGEVLDALVVRLTPADLYRVTWMAPDRTTDAEP